MIRTTEATIRSSPVLIAAVPTRWGDFGAAISPIGLGRLTFPSEPRTACDRWAKRWYSGYLAEDQANAALLALLADELDAYLDGQLQAFSIPLDPRGTTFQLAVWRNLLEIPFGTTRSYGEVARAIGRPTAVRAVGAANGSNPIPILVPCHRVIGQNGSLVGYGGGLELKQRLLALEGIIFSPREGVASEALDEEW